MLLANMGCIVRKNLSKPLKLPLNTNNTNFLFHSTSFSTEWLQECMMHLAHCLYNAAPLGHAAPVAVEKCRPRTGCPLPMKILDPPLATGPLEL